jgi:hypothetical protein
MDKESNINKLTFFWCKSVQFMELKNGCAIISFASSGPPPSLLLGFLTSKPPNISLASFEIVRGNFTYKKASTH